MIHKPDMDRFLNIRKDLVNGPENFRQIEDIQIQANDLKELQNLYQNSSKQPQFHLISQEEAFLQKERDLSQALSQIEISQKQQKKIPECSFKKFIHYDLSKVNYDEKSTLTNAFEFLKDLEDQKKQESLQNQFQKMELEQNKLFINIRPTFQTTKKLIPKKINHLNQGMQTLSFQDKFDD